MNAAEREANAAAFESLSKDSKDATTIAAFVAVMCHMGDHPFLYQMHGEMLEAIDGFLNAVAKLDPKFIARAFATIGVVEVAP